MCKPRLQADSPGASEAPVKLFETFECGKERKGSGKGMRFVSPKSSGSFWKGGCYEIFFIFYKVLDPFPVSCLSLTRSHIFKLAKVKIRLFGAPQVSDRHWVQTLSCTTKSTCPSFLAWPGTLWPEGSKGLSRFPRWIRHQTGQGRVWIPRWVESTQKSRRHEKKSDAQNEEKTKFPTSIALFLLRVLFRFLV